MTMATCIEWHYMQSSKPCCLTLVQQTEGSGNGFKLHAYQAMHAECAQLYDVRWAMYADHTAKDSLPAQCILICDTTVSMLPTHRKTRNIAAICKGQPTLMNE